MNTKEVTSQKNRTSRQILSAEGHRKDYQGKSICIVYWFHIFPSNISPTFCTKNVAFDFPKGEHPSSKQSPGIGELLIAGILQGFEMIQSKYYPPIPKQ